MLSNEILVIANQNIPLVFYLPSEIGLACLRFYSADAVKIQNIAYKLKLVNLGISLNHIVLTLKSSEQ